MARVNLSNGPSLLDLLIAFAKRYERTGERPRSVHFQIAPGGTICGEGERENKISTLIESIAWEDGSGEKLNFTGRLLHRADFVVRGHFDIRARKGWMEISTA